MSGAAFPDLRLAYLYPRLMNLYSDRGNVECLRRRCEWRGIDLRVIDVELGEAPDFSGFDLIFIGGGEDRQQTIAARDLLDIKGPALRAALAGGAVCLAVCGGFQLLARSYRTAGGEQLPGLGHFRAHTVHPGSTAARLTGNVAARLADGWMVGFENHGGRTYLDGSVPLAMIVSGHGNNGKDGTEGAIEGNAIGTYLHGSLLPKNPALADDLLHRALLRRGSARPLPALDDALERAAQHAMLARLKVSI